MGKTPKDSERFLKTPKKAKKRPGKGAYFSPACFRMLFKVPFGISAESQWKGTVT